MEIKNRCSWCTQDKIYQDYHDYERGKPVHNDRILFELLILEGAQAGLSRLTILKKREQYRKAFDNFDVQKVANYKKKKYNELLDNKGIIRNKLKIQSAIQNAKVFIEIQKEFGSFDRYIWNFVDNKVIKNTGKNSKKVPTKTPLSDKVAKDLQTKGMSFVGSTIIYAYIQAIGMVNTHTQDCDLYNS